MFLNRGLIGISILLLLGNSATAAIPPHQLNQRTVQLLVNNMPSQGVHVYVPNYLPLGFKLNKFDLVIRHEMTHEVSYHIDYSYNAYLPTEHQSVVYRLQWDVYPINNPETANMKNVICSDPKLKAHTFNSRILGPIKTCVIPKSKEQPFWQVSGGTNGIHIMAVASSLEELTRIIENTIELKRP